MIRKPPRGAMHEITVRNRQRCRPLDVRHFRKIAVRLLELQLGARPCEIAVSVVGAPEMAALNERYLEHQGSTDVITFGYSESDGPEPLIGDLFICMEDAVTQAREFRTSWQSEIVRYFIHGLLHLLGHDDLRPAPRRVMKREEDRLVRWASVEFPLAKLGKATRVARGRPKS